MNISGGPGNGAGDAATVRAAEADGEEEGEPGAELTLAPDPSAARAARAWVAEVLADWPEGAVDRARLLVSELVTNAVLHARTEISLGCRLEEASARFEVGDRQRGGPTPKRYVADSPTGRGMRLGATLAEAWGVERTPSSKVVWFAVARDVPAPVAAGGGGPGAGSDPLGPLGSDPLGAVDLELLAATLGEPALPPDAEAGGTPMMVRVRILGLPLDIYLEAEQHNDAVLRELDLIERSPRRCPQVPPRLLALAAALRALFTAATTSTRAQVDEALRMGRARVDLDVDVPAEGWQALMEMAQQLEEVDRYCQEGALLTLASSPQQRRFRRWYADQVARQMQGGRPTPWADDPEDA